MSIDFSYQAEPVNRALNFYKDSENKNAIIIVPTGGGKTIIAFKIIDSLFKQKILRNKDEVLWVVHSKDLINQTKKDIRDIKNKKNINVNIDNLDKINIKSIKKGKDYLEKNKVKFLIIDEAHRAAAPTYSAFFGLNLKVLGLTATPTRTDKKDLDFEEIYFISFSDLIKKGILVEPNFINKTTGFKNDDSDIDKIQFNQKQRNEIIANEFLNNSEKYIKSILFVEYNDHMEELYKVIVEKNKQNKKYEYIEYFNAKKNSKNEHRDKFLKEFKSKENGILVTNTRVLSEGFNDPSIRTVSLCVPTKSDLKYIQCIGRGFRKDEDKNKINIVQFIDTLPNAGYLIDGGFLSAYLSTKLEPIIKSIDFDDLKDLRKKLNEIDGLDNKKINNLFKDCNEDTIEEKNVFLWNGSDQDYNKKHEKWEHIIINNKNRDLFRKFFNRISNNFEELNQIRNSDMFYFQWKKDFLEKINLHEIKRKRTLRFAFKNSYNSLNNNNIDSSLKYLIFRKNKVEFIKRNNILKIILVVVAIISVILIIKFI